uniref:Uncharacterized protein n=1 Tax=Pseudonaja textilis TaxID=8673 RepID=A0A670ZGU7_PSETE
MFKEPVEILPQRVRRCSDSHYDTKGLKEVSQKSPTSSKRCFSLLFLCPSGNNNGTIEDRQRPEVVFYCITSEN